MIPDDNNKDVILKINQYKTAQLLQVAKQDDGSSVETYAITTMVTASSYDYSQYDSQWDKYGGVKAYSTLYVDYWTDSRDVRYWDIISVDGGWDVSDSTYTLSGLKVSIGQNGLPPSSIAVTQAKDFYPTSRTYSYNYPSEWVPVLASTSGTNNLNHKKKETKRAVESAFLFLTMCLMLFKGGIVVKWLGIGAIMPIISSIIALSLNNKSIIFLLCGILGALSFGLSIILSGALITGDRSRANDFSEQTEDRKARMKWSLKLMLVALPNIAAAIIALRF